MSSNCVQRRFEDLPGRRPGRHGLHQCVVGRHPRRTVHTTDRWLAWRSVPAWRRSNAGTRRDAERQRLDTARRGAGPSGIMIVFPI